MPTRKILHLDLDAFFCAVEELRDPKLRGKAFAVGGRPEQRGVVASCSYAARRYGVRSALPMARAVKLCPELIIVSHNFKAYREASRQVMDILHELTPLVEQISIDEAFLDVSERPETIEEIAQALQTEINMRLNLPCSLGAATNKLVAKIANNVGKDAARNDAPPNAITIVPPGEEAAFLAPLAVRELWGVGPKTAEHLVRLGVNTIGDLAAWPADDLAQRFGKNGADMARRARGIDDRAVEPEHEIKSVSKETTFARDVRDGEALRREMRRLCEGVSVQLRANGLRGSTIKLKLRWANFTTLTRQTTLAVSTDRVEEIYQAAREIFDTAWPTGKAVRLIGVGVSGFEVEDESQQLDLWESAPPPPPLQNALDALRDKFGNQIVKRGAELKKKKNPKA
jgi:DNA polymerase-4